MMNAIIMMLGMMMVCCYDVTSSNRERGSVVDSADAMAVSNSGHLDVALIAPYCSPRVLDLEEVVAVVRAESDSQHTMVEGT
jgi:hypothetical protein